MMSLRCLGHPKYRFGTDICVRLYICVCVCTGSHMQLTSVIHHDKSFAYIISFIEEVAIIQIIHFTG